MQDQTIKKKILQFAILFAVALALHLPGITFHSLWFDETSTAYMVSQHGMGNLYKNLFTFEGTPPLFFILEKAFIKTFSLPLNEFSLRFLPVLYGSIACVLIFFIFCETSGRRTAILAYITVAVSNFYVYLFHEARCYSLLTMMALLSLWLVLQWWKKSNIPWTIALFISVALTVQVHYFALLWISVIGLSVLIIKKKDRQLFVFLGLIAVASCLSFGALMPLFITQRLHEVGTVRSELTGKWFWGIFYSPIKVLVGANLFKMYSIRDMQAFDLLSILPTVILVMTAGYFLIGRLVKNSLSDSEKIVFFCVFFAFLFHAILGSKVPTVHPRYMSHFLILLFGCVLAGAGRSKKLQILFFSVFIAMNCIANIRYYDRSLAYIEPWKDIAIALDKSIDLDGAGNVPVISNFVTCHAVAFYLKNKTAELYCIPSYTTKADFARLDVFGSTCWTHLYHYDFYPIVKQASFLDIVKEKSHGILLTKDKSGPVRISQLKEDYKGVLDFSLLRIFATYQGDLSILSWRYIGDKTGSPD
jgi:uncharacterized membrane protein